MVNPSFSVMNGVNKRFRLIVYLSTLVQKNQPRATSLIKDHHRCGWFLFMRVLR